MHRLRLAVRPGPSAPFRAAARPPCFRRGVQELFEVGAKPSEWNQAGRAWRASELRLKSFDDLHKLWYVLLKEKNLLLSQREMMDENGQKAFKRKNSRLWKVKKSMARLLTVLSERKITYKEYKAGFKRAKGKPAADTAATATQGDAAAKPAAPAAEGAIKKGRGKERRKAAAVGAEGIAKRVAAAAVKGGPIGKRRSALSRKKPAAKAAVGATGGAEAHPAPAAEKPKKEKIKRNWKEIRVKWKADKAGGVEPAAPAAGSSPPAESPAAQETK